MILPPCVILIAMRKCKNCSKELTTKRSKTYCSQLCQADARKKKTLSDWLERKIPGHNGKVMNVKRVVRDYIFEKYGSKCCQCGWNTPHPKTGKPPLDVNHIDGDASNTYEDNLNLLCPNCHSLTLNYKNFNKNGKRNR